MRVKRRKKTTKKERIIKMYMLLNVLISVIFGSIVGMIFVSNYEYEIINNKLCVLLCFVIIILFSVLLNQSLIELFN